MTALPPRAAERIGRLREAMERTGTDLVLVPPGANLVWLLGLELLYDERPAALFVGRDQLRMLVPALNATQAAEVPGLPLLPWSDEEGPDAAIRAARDAMGRVRTVAVDAAARADTILPMLDILVPENAVLATPLVAPLRMRKSTEEIAAIERAALQADRVMAMGIAACAAGAAETQVAAVMENGFRSGGASRVDFAIVASGPNSAIPHHHTGARRLEAGEPVILDIGATLAGYRSDITRMAYLGAPAPEFVRAYDAVRLANERARAAIRPGATAAAIDHAARSTLASAGLDAYFVHRTGHGLGLEGHEPPWITATSDTVLEPGMVFSVEPGVYFPGRWGIRIEDIVVVTGDGARTLNTATRDLAIRD